MAVVLQRLAGSLDKHIKSRQLFQGSNNHEEITVFVVWYTDANGIVGRDPWAYAHKSNDTKLKMKMHLLRSHFRIYFQHFNLSIRVSILIPNSWFLVLKGQVFLSSLGLDDTISSKNSWKARRNN
jgi:hypothetical protein